MLDRRLRVPRRTRTRGNRDRNASFDDAVQLNGSGDGSLRSIADSLVDSAVYVEGERASSPETLGETYRCLRGESEGLAWIDLYRPDAQALASLASGFGLHELAVEDAIAAHQRPKLERYGETLFVVLRAARYRDAAEEVDLGELHVFVGSDFVVTLRHGEAPDLTAVRTRMEASPELLRRGPEAVLYAILDKVVDGYAPVVTGLDNDIEEIETEVFSRNPQVSKRIYELSREVIEFQRATRPLLGMLSDLTESGDYAIDSEIARYLRDVSDHVTTVVERVDGFRQLLQDILSVNATLVSQQQNEEMKSLTEASLSQNEEVKKISGWAAILFAPTLIGTIYGMNFRGMPELDWQYGYPFALALMALTSAALYGFFKHRRWL